MKLLLVLDNRLHCTGTCGLGLAKTTLPPKVELDHGISNIRSLYGLAILIPILNITLRISIQSPDVVQGFCGIQPPFSMGHYD
jgi:hypothetical protein